MCWQMQDSSSHCLTTQIAKHGGVFFGQLLGMADHVTYTLGTRGYAVYKYVMCELGNVNGDGAEK